ncbi:MAG: DUF1080 domain-containing protein [Planctomycetia bacterium]|nr:DUF1080 domain-containing protein [Planctomycetia bacterium]
MTRSVHGLAVAAALLLLSPTRPAVAADDDGFKPLFNGKDLTGWVTPDNKGLFSAEDGQIVGRSKQKELKKNEFLVTDRPYGDFVLKAKVKYKDGNSGIQFRSKREANGKVSGPQADIADGWWGTFYEENGRGVLEKYDPKKAAALVKEEDWNEFVITARGDHVTIDFNGTRIIDRTDPKFEKTGIIALQLHAGPPMEIRFKDVAIKTLD